MIATLRTLITLFSLAACCAQAQTYTIDWYTIDGGGGISSGGVYTLSGTIGQPDAGTHAGGNYSLIGGFWAVAAVIQTPGAPLLTIDRDVVTGAVTVSWTRPADGWILEQTGNMASPPAAIPWSPVPATTYQTNATHISITFPAPAGSRYYRLRQ